MNSIEHLMNDIEPLFKVDAGHWDVSNNGRSITSDDFAHDVSLKVIGDFHDDKSRHAYSTALAVRLNGLPKEPSAALLHSMALRYRHDFDLECDSKFVIGCGTTQAERESILTIMRQLYEEVSGHGFHKS